MWSATRTFRRPGVSFLLATLLLLACPSDSDPADDTNATTTGTPTTTSSDATLSTSSTDPSTSSSNTSTTDPSTSSTSTDAESTTADTSSTSTADTSSSSGGLPPSDYDELCMMFAAKLEECFPRDVDEQEQFMFCIEGMLAAEATSKECLAATEGFVDCRANLTCEQLEADNCVVFDGMVEKFC